MTTTKSKTITVELFGASRLKNSANGNPRFILHTDQGDLRTQSDASCSHDVENITRRIRHSVQVALTMTPKTERVWKIEVLPTAADA